MTPLLLKRPSASNAEAFVKCGASHLLPQADRHGEHRDLGSEAHEPLAAFINKRIPITTLRGVQAVRDFAIGSVLGDNSGLRGEVAYAVDVRDKTSRFLGQDLGRKYGPLKQFEIPCTIDVEGVRPDGTRWIRDWKFGTYASWWQLLVQAMAVAYPAQRDHPPYDQVDAGFVFIDPHVHGAYHQTESKILTLEDIDEAAETLYGAWKRLLAAEADKKLPDPTVGKWCKYCHAFPFCRAQWALVAAMLGATEYLEERVPTLTPEKMGQAWANIREVKDRIERIEDALKGAAMRKSLPLPNGKYLTMIEAAGRVSVDKEKAFETIKRLGGNDADCDAVLKRGKPYLTAKETKKP